ncbi:MAG: helix-turn-helix domain-containing protein [Gammaproteobacteria bacterium]
MSARRRSEAETRSLEILDISEPEERAYRWLLAHPRAAVPEIAQALALTPSKAQRLLDSVEAKGLTTHSPEKPRRYIPAPPDIAVEALVRRRQEELDRARMTVPELQEQMAARREDEQEQIVELITSREAEHQTYEQLMHMARQEIAVLVRPPILYDLLDVQDVQKTQREVQARGVQCRSINDAEFLALPGAIDGVRADVKAGEEARAFPDFPFKLLLVDHRVALIPLNPNRINSPLLLVRGSALLDALYALFEILWERAVPILFTPADVLKTGDVSSRIPKGAEDLISLMTAGLNDKKIAYELGISASTLTRRISETMKAFNVRNRFQLGLLTGKRLYNHDDG